VVVTNGLSQGLSLVARALVERGATRFGVEDPGHPGPRDVLRASGGTVHAVPVDAAGGAGRPPRRCRLGARVPDGWLPPAPASHPEPSPRARLRRADPAEIDAGIRALAAATRAMTTSVRG